ncbi:MAG: FAD-dependent monooxygenase [Pseudomonadota bacterium]
MHAGPERDVYDAVIVGARCAGAATALLLARQGARVLMIDRDHALEDTLSTHALTRPAVRLLSAWGLLDDLLAADTPLITQTTFHYGQDQIDIPIRSDAQVPGLVAPRRWVLDRFLRDTAVRDGAEFCSSVNFVGVGRDLSDRIRGATLQFPNGTTRTICTPMVIGADGVRSSVAKVVGTYMLSRSKACTSTAYTYVSGVENRGYRLYFQEGGITGLIPTTNGLHCLFSQIKPGSFIDEFAPNAYRTLLSALGSWEPHLAEELERRGPTERVRRFPGVRGYLRTCAGPGWALVGDAGCFKDPCTAYGITDALADAHHLARAMLKTNEIPNAYQIERDGIAPEIFRLTQEIAEMNWDLERVKSLHLDLNRHIHALDARLCRDLHPDTVLSTEGAPQ